MRTTLLLLAFFGATMLLRAQHTRLDVTPVAPGIWVHTTYNLYKGETFPANGLIVETEKGILLVDTGWGEKATRKLLRWIKRHLHKPVVAVVITHAHDDRAGGLAVLQAQKVAIQISDRTAAILEKQGLPTRPYQAIADDERQVLGQVAYEVFYPGHGHAPDNVVVYFPQAQLLFGGCFVKSLEAATLGNIADADLAEWPEALRRVQKRFPEARTVIPGHQAWSGPELLDHTLKLLETAPK